MDFVSLDFETANSERTSICQIGLAVFEKGKLVDKQSLLVKPEPYYFMPINIMVHGILPEDVVDKPTFDKYWKKISHYFINHEMIAHNAAFDFSVLRHSLNFYDIPVPEITYYCSLMMSRKLMPGLPSYSLANICDHFSIHFKHHDAADDAEAAGRLMVELLKMHKVNSLAEVSEKNKFQKGKLLSDGYIPFSTTGKKAKKTYKYY